MKSLNLMIFFISIIISMIIFIFSFYILELSINMSKVSSKLEVECGMFNITNKKESSLMYFLFIIVFLIFDLEISLVLFQTFKLMNIMFFLIITLMMLSLLLELYEMSLKWND